MQMPLMINFSNTYSQLGDTFYQRILPTPVSKPEVLFWNEQLAERLNIERSLRNDPLLKAQYFSGNKMPEGADSIALAYSGHQFGQLNPQLGDGRAHLMGEVVTPSRERFDIQLKGSGPTSFSRQGDGRCALGPAIREYIMSEAMYSLGVPTTRCLAVVTTGEPVYREGVRPGAVVTRVAASHIRVGTFQYFSIRNDMESLQALLDYTVARHFPEIDPNSEDRAIQFLEAAIAKQIRVVVEWMRIGFIHGVMNTDNTAISGETIDYGPCAMMGIYNPNTVYSSIDRQGRYAFGNQPGIAMWNMARLAECLLPLIDSDEKKAIAAAEPVLMQFGPQFEAANLQMLANKFGITDNTLLDKALIDTFLQKMMEQQLDYTQTFIDLRRSLDDDAIGNELASALGESYLGWRKLIGDSKQGIELSKKLMIETNPIVIPRNHHVEAVLKSCEETGCASAAEDFLCVLKSPYKELSTTKNYQDLPVDNDRHYKTFCGT